MTSFLLRSASGPTSCPAASEASFAARNSPSRSKGTRQSHSRQLEVVGQPVQEIGTNGSDPVAPIPVEQQVAARLAWVIADFSGLLGPAPLRLILEFVQVAPDRDPQGGCSVRARSARSPAELDLTQTSSTASSLAFLASALAAARSAALAFRAAVLSAALAFRAAVLSMAAARFAAASSVSWAPSWMRSSGPRCTSGPRPPWPRLRGPSMVAAIDPLVAESSLSPFTPMGRMSEVAACSVTDVWPIRSSAEPEASGDPFGPAPRSDGTRRRDGASRTPWLRRSTPPWRPCPRRAG